MGIQIKILITFFSLIFLYVVLKKVRREFLKPFYAQLWISFALFMLAVVWAEPAFKWVSDTVFGFTDARHTIYIGLFGFLFLYAFYATLALNRMQEQMKVLISEVAITAALKKENLLSHKQEEN